MCLAIPMKVIEILPSEMAKVELEGLTQEISTKLLDKVKPGDYVLVHTGFALEVINKDEAEGTLEIFRQLKSF